MKTYFFVLMLTFLSVAVEAKQPDIVVKSHLDTQTSSSVIKRARSFMIHNDLGDPFNYVLPKPLTIELTKALKLLPDKTLLWIKEFQKLLNLQILDSTFNLRVDGLRYEVMNFNSILSPSESSQRVEYVTANIVNGLSIKADRIVFEVELNRTTSGKPIYFEIVVVAPELFVNQAHFMEIPMKWETNLGPNGIEIVLNQIDISRVIKKIVGNPSMVEITIDDLVMPDVSIKIGHKTLALDKKKIKNFLIKGQNDFKDAIINLLNVNAEERFANILGDEPLEFVIPRTFSVSDGIHAVFHLDQMLGLPKKEMVQFIVDAHFCDNPTNISEDFCFGRPIEAKERRKVTDIDFAQSLKAMDHILESRDASLAFSVSEQYLNELIEASDRAGVLNLNGEDFKLGPQRAFVLADEKGTGFSIYLDIIYTLDKRSQLLTGKKQLQFPVKLKVGVKIENTDEMPYLYISVLKVDSDSKLLLNGLSKYGLKSNINSARFKKKILEQVTQEIKRFQGEILVSLPLNIFKGLHLEDANFQSDGHGRAMATIPLDGNRIIK